VLRPELKAEPLFSDIRESLEWSSSLKEATTRTSIRPCLFQICTSPTSIPSKYCCCLSRRSSSSRRTHHTSSTPAIIYSNSSAAYCINKLNHRRLCTQLRDLISSFPASHQQSRSSTSERFARTSADNTTLGRRTQHTAGFRDILRVLRLSIKRLKPWRPRKSSGKHTFAIVLTHMQNHRSMEVLLAYYDIV